jgi:hypothetical protein
MPEPTRIAGQHLYSKDGFMANERQDDASTVRKLVQDARIVTTSDLADRREVLRSLKRGCTGIAVEYVPPCP